MVETRFRRVGGLPGKDSVLPKFMDYLHIVTRSSWGRDYNQVVSAGTGRHGRILITADALLILCLA